MRSRWKLILLAVIGALALAVGFAVAGVLWGPFSFASTAAKVKEEATLLNGRDPQRMLAGANRFYWGDNLPRYVIRALRHSRRKRASNAMDPRFRGDDGELLAVTTAAPHPARSARRPLPACGERAGVRGGWLIPWSVGATWRNRSGGAIATPGRRIYNNVIAGTAH